MMQWLIFGLRPDSLTFWKQNDTLHFYSRLVTCDFSSVRTLPFSAAMLLSDATGSKLPVTRAPFPLSTATLPIPCHGCSFEATSRNLSRIEESEGLHALD